MSSDCSFETNAIHSSRSAEDPHHATHFPIYDCATFTFDSSEAIAAGFSGTKPAHIYSRSSNPTVAHFESKIKTLTGAQGVLATASGQAAIGMLIMAMCQSGDNLVTTKFLFGNSYSLFNDTFRAWGLKPRFVDMENLQEVEAAIDSNTRGIFLETISNPQLQVADLKALKQLAEKYKIPLITDSTATPPNVFSAKAQGIDVEVISSTKMISGGGTSIGGLIIDYGSYNWHHNPKLKPLAEKDLKNSLLFKLRKEVFRNMGPCLAPHNAYMQSLGLETLELRTAKACENALEIATFLDSHPKVARVNYPGLQSSEYHKLAMKQFNNRPGSILTFNLKSQKNCFDMMDNLNIICRATNLHDNKTLIIHPFSTIVLDLDERDTQDMLINDTLLRLTSGIESTKDLCRDLSQALEQT